MTGCTFLLKDWWIFYICDFLLFLVDLKKNSFGVSFIPGIPLLVAAYKSGTSQYSAAWWCNFAFFSFIPISFLILYLLAYILLSCLCKSYFYCQYLIKHSQQVSLKQLLIHMVLHIFFSEILKEICYLDYDSLSSRSQEKALLFYSFKKKKGILTLYLKRKKISFMCFSLDSAVVGAYLWESCIHIEDDVVNLLILLLLHMYLLDPQQQCIFFPHSMQQAVFLVLFLHFTVIITLIIFIDNNVHFKIKRVHWRLYFSEYCITVYCLWHSCLWKGQ